LIMDESIYVKYYITYRYVFNINSKLTVKSNINYS